MRNHADGIITGDEDRLDSRDIIERIKWLEIDEEALDEEEKKELAALRQFNEEGESEFSDWNDGIRLIGDWCIDTFAREHAIDIGVYKDDYSWPTSHIDWSDAAEQLQEDMTSIEFCGSTYWGFS